MPLGVDIDLGIDLTVRNTTRRAYDSPEAGVTGRSIWGKVIAASIDPDPTMGT